MFNFSDNTTHLLQLAMILAAGVVLIIYAPSIPPIAVLTMLSTPVGILIGAKVTQNATNAANAANAASPPSIVAPAPAPVAAPPTPTTATG